ncbi:hypothetical protein [Myroides odoratus]|uniref:Uncharacterized protein n=1 Tax=Myroides odoratus TaxID=256 RepID=A0A9Q6Z348_MYROD|nr:hypothetical protein [Myroides odoratus]EHQ41539.1 hypothetical protein Myrod_0703 [Myroides odoratus DSM 2801]EKB02764.1 hypothetical protein HMPREF9716_03697 [Myroides odoratus CIP 103059]QQT98958.1 hypothetical protein I6I88_12125 [Myroides odoratus]WQD58854.1 hypothetical protein U0010_06850 [Myroides odoratus]STZ28802.1 Uncharacterised protein [Myroides odoratus]
MTDLEYIENKEAHGAYQYVSLKTIIDNMVLESLDDDSYLKNTARFRLLQYAKQGIRELTQEAANDILAFEITVPDNLVVVVPKDYVNWVRISLVTRDPITNGFMLQPLNENRNINTAIGYLQDHKGDLLFDNKGMILTSDSSNAFAHPYKRYKVSDLGSCGQGKFLDTSKVSKYGEFVIDERKGVILFSSDLMDKEVVIEYISDGLQAELSEEEVTVHKDLQQTLENWIYYACIERRRNVPANEKQRALLRYKTTLHEAKLDRLNLKLYEIIRHF